jgi:hypothetical protein
LALIISQDAASFKTAHGRDYYNITEPPMLPPTFRSERNVPPPLHGVSLGAGNTIPDILVDKIRRHEGATADQSTMREGYEALRLLVKDLPEEIGRGEAELKTRKADVARYKGEANALLLPKTRASEPALSEAACKAAITRGKVVVTGTHHGFTKEEVDKYEYLSTMRAHASKAAEVLISALPKKREELARLEASLETLAGGLKAKGIIETSLENAVPGLCETGYYMSIGIMKQNWCNAFTGGHVNELFKAENLAKMWVHLEAAYKLAKMEEKFLELKSDLKPLFDLFAEGLPLLRTTRMLTPREKARALAICKALPRLLHELCPERGVQVKTFMVFYHMHDFIMKFGTIGMFCEDAFEARHATRNGLKRRFACIRCTATRDQCIDTAYASMRATRATREDAIERTKRAKV